MRYFSSWCVRFKGLAPNVVKYAKRAVFYRRELFSTAVVQGNRENPRYEIFRKYLQIQLYSHCNLPKEAGIEEDVAKLESIFHFVWLRDNCPCEKCIHPSTKQKLHTSGDIPTDLQPKSVRWVLECKENQWEPYLEIIWPIFAFPSQSPSAGSSLRTFHEGQIPVGQRSSEVHESFKGCIEVNAGNDCKVVNKCEMHPPKKYASASFDRVQEDCHISRYPLSFLQYWDYSNLNIGRKIGEVTSKLVPLHPRPQTWNASSRSFSVKTIDYKSLPLLSNVLKFASIPAGSSKSIAQQTKDIAFPPLGCITADAVNELATRGLLLIKNVPTNLGNDYIETLAKRFGNNLYSTFYGSSWDVRNEGQPNNVAYTSLFLGLHMDLMYFEAPPGLQFLHMLNKSVQGGTSLFMDCLDCWKSFAQSSCAEVTDILSQVPISYHYDHGHRRIGHPHHLHFRHALASQNLVGQKSGLCHPSDDASCTGLYFSPPFQAPLEVPADKVEKWYQAIKLWESHLRKQSLLKIDLEPGDAVVFQNRRILHGRTAFEVNGMRHLRGCYISYDDFKDRWRVVNSNVCTA
jgi:alpha-ketoglutarate-dependent taurine dioxygenase